MYFKYAFFAQKIRILNYLVSEKTIKKYKTDCSNTEGVLRIVMSVPSPKAEPYQTMVGTSGS